MIDFSNKQSSGAFRPLTCSFCSMVKHPKAPHTSVHQKPNRSILVFACVRCCSEGQS